MGCGHGKPTCRRGRCSAGFGVWDRPRAIEREHPLGRLPQPHLPLGVQRLDRTQPGQPPNRLGGYPLGQCPPVALGGWATQPAGVPVAPEVTTQCPHAIVQAAGGEERPDALHGAGSSRPRRSAPAAGLEHVQEVGVFHRTPPTPNIKLSSGGRAERLNQEPASRPPSAAASGSTA